VFQAVESRMVFDPRSKKAKIADKAKLAPIVEDEEEDVEWLSPREYGEREGGASKDTVKKWIENGKIKAYKRGGQYVIPDSELGKILEEV